MTGISAFAQNSAERQDLLEEIEKDITENILPFWMEKSGDNYSDALFSIKGKAELSAVMKTGHISLEE